MLVNPKQDLQLCCRVISEDSFELFRVRHNDQHRFIWELLGQSSIGQSEFTPKAGFKTSAAILDQVDSFRSRLLHMRESEPASFNALRVIGELTSRIAKLDKALTSDEFEMLIWAEAGLRGALTANKGLELLGASDQEGQILRGNQLMSEGREAEAEPIFEAILEADPFSHRVHNFLALSLFKQGKLDLAVEKMRRAVSLSNENVGYILRLIHFLMAAEQIEEASILIKEQVSLVERFSPEQKLQLSRFAKRVENNEAAYQLAVSILASGNPSVDEIEHTVNCAASWGGEELAFKVLRDNPLSQYKAPNLLQWRIRQMINEGNFVEALDLAKNWTKTAPKSAQAWFLLGRVFKTMNRPKRATHCLEKAIEYDSRHVQSFKLLAESYLELGQPEVANVFAQKAVELDPDNKNFRNLVSVVDKRLAGLKTDLRA